MRLISWTLRSGSEHQSSTTLTLKKFILTFQFVLGFSKISSPTAYLRFTVLLATMVNH